MLWTSELEVHELIIVCAAHTAVANTCADNADLSRLHPHQGLVLHCREDTGASEEDEREKARLRQAEAMREAEARKERKRRATERKAAQKVAASKAKEVQKSAAAAAAAVPEPKEDVSGRLHCSVSVKSVVRYISDAEP